MELRFETTWWAVPSLSYFSKQLLCTSSVFCTIITSASFPTGFVNVYHPPNVNSLGVRIDHTQESEVLKRLLGLRRSCFILMFACHWCCPGCLPSAWYSHLPCFLVPVHLFPDLVLVSCLTLFPKLLHHWWLLSS